MHTLNLDIQYADQTHDWSVLLPESLLTQWVQAALQGDADLTLRFVDEAEGRELNREYRGKDYATNVLTFAYSDDDEFADLPEDVRAEMMAELNPNQATQADIVLCCKVLEREATEQHKTLVEHAAHLVVHGVLHAQGYDHIDPDEAEEMESLETQIIMGLGFADPY